MIFPCGCVISNYLYSDSNTRKIIISQHKLCPLAIELGRAGIPVIQLGSALSFVLSVLYSALFLISRSVCTPRSLNGPHCVIRTGFSVSTLVDVVGVAMNSHGDLSILHVTDLNIHAACPSAGRTIFALVFNKLSTICINSRLNVRTAVCISPFTGRRVEFLFYGSFSRCRHCNRSSDDSSSGHSCENLRNFHFKSPPH